MMRHWLWVFMVIMIAACEPETAFVPTPTAVIALEQTFSGTDLLGGVVQVAYPAGWSQAGTADNLLLSNDANILANPQADMPAGSVAVSIITLPASLAGLSVAEGQSPTPYNILLRFLQTAQQTNPTTLYGEPALTVVNGQAAAVAQGSDASDESLIWVVNLGTGYSIAVAVADKGAMASHLPTIEALLTSLRYGN